LFLDTDHETGDGPAVIDYAGDNSNLGSGCQIIGIRPREDNEFVSVAKWSDVESFLDTHRALVDVVVKGTKADGSSFTSLVKIARELASSVTPANSAPSGASDGLFLGVTHGSGDAPLVITAATSDSNLDAGSTIRGIRGRNDTDYVAVTKWSEIEAFVIAHMSDRAVVVRGTKADGSPFVALVKLRDPK
jgi:hypothetical protein